MARATRTFPISKDAFVATAGGNSTGAGRHSGLPAGLYNGGLHRSLLAFVNDWSGMFAIYDIELKIRTSSQIRVLFGSSPSVFIQRVTSGWAEGTQTLAHAINGVNWNNQPSATATDQVAHNPGVAEGVLRTISILALYRQMAPPELGGENVLNNGIRIIAQNEGTTADCSEFYSRETAFDASVVVTYEDNVVPDAPTITSPAHEAYTNTAGGTDVVIAGTYSDPNGDACAAVQVQVLSDAATDAAPGAAAQDVTVFAPDGRITGGSWWLALTGLAARTWFRPRARVKDSRGDWGAWSSVTTQRFRTNAKPVGAAPTVDPGTVSPHFYGSIMDADAGATLSAARVVVYEDLLSGTVTKWDSGQVTIGGASVRFDLTYGGSLLLYGIGYRWQFEVWDNDGQKSELSGHLYFTQYEPVGPTTVTPNNTNTKQATTTPTITVSHGTNFDQWQYEIYPDINADGTPAGAIADTWVATIASTTTTNRAVPAGKLGNGRTYYLRARIRLVGNANLGDWSPLFPFYINAIPSAPTALAPGGPSLATEVRVPTLTPTLQARYVDADLAHYNDKPTERIVEISLANSPFTVVHSHTQATPSYSDPMVYAVPGATLSNEVSYRHRWRFKDDAAAQSPWSEYAYFRTSLPPTATLVAPTEAAVISTPAPLLDWAYASPGGNAQTAYRVRVWATTSLLPIFDTGIVASAATAVTLPPHLLATGLGYSWVVEVWDVNGLLGTMATATFSTTFTTPPAPTGLVALPDPASGNVVLAWDASAVPAAEFLEWRLYRRNQPDSPFELVATIADKDMLAYTDYGTAYGADGAAYRLSQHNGYRESDTDEASAVLLPVAAGAWTITVPGEERYHFEVTLVTSGPRQFRQAREEHHALDRSHPIVEHGPTLGAAGSLSILLPPEDWYLEGRLREIAELPEPANLRTPYGDSWQVRLGTISSNPAASGIIELSVEYTQVGVAAGLVGRIVYVVPGFQVGFQAGFQLGV